MLFASQRQLIPRSSSHYVPRCTRARENARCYLRSRAAHVQLFICTRARLSFAASLHDDDNRPPLFSRRKRRKGKIRCLSTTWKVISSRVKPRVLRNVSMT
ncbi:hypothetical protein PUN28_014075 [Cardiocondyla obscurior]|uniref:Uncharacterized protein n=1 Tax=Cardiocondyla obscurior TaxID=286306 RepID=A0AAW2F8L7_9HYME